VSDLKIEKTLDFYLDDFSKTLFPLKTNRYLISSGHEKIEEYIAKCLDETEKSHHFLPQQRVYAAKRGFHLRRTLKLDFVCEYYIYDIVFKNKKAFKKPDLENRVHYGYKFQDGRPVTSTSAYRAFKSAIAEYSKEYSYFISFDIAS